jgi:endonuclease G, mitochondrial
MKKLLLILLLPTLTVAQQRPLYDSVAIDKGIYKVMYSEKLEQPLWVKYRVTCLDGKAQRNGMDFRIETEYFTSDDADYANNEWDKGHLAPAADFNCSKMDLWNTFSYANCALQQERLNRGLWRLLEAQEREWAKQEPVSIYIRLVFKNSKKLTTGASVPSGFYKTIYFENSKKTRIFYFDNVIPPQGKTFWDYEIK